MDDRLLIGVGSLAIGLALGMLLRALDNRTRSQRLEAENRELARRLQSMKSRRPRDPASMHEDGLTGLPGGSVFRERLEGEIARARRYQRPLGVILVSFDVVEDRGGAEVADAVAVDATCMTVARAQADLVREQDVVARLDERTFGLLLPETSPFGTKALADRLRRLLEGLYVEWDEAALRVRPYVGASATVGGGTDGARMLQVAEDGMQGSRAKGGAEVTYASSTRTRIQSPI